jgi:hypothetical protein
MIKVGELRSIHFPLNNANGFLVDIISDHVVFDDDDEIRPEELPRVESLWIRLNAITSDLRMLIDGTYPDEPSQPKEPTNE